jgi:hypothetical protein
MDRSSSAPAALSRPRSSSRATRESDGASDPVVAIYRVALPQVCVRFQTEVAAGVSVDTMLLEDAAGNPIDLFQPRECYHERGQEGSRDHRTAHRRPMGCRPGSSERFYVDTLGFE